MKPLLLLLSLASLVLADSAIKPLTNANINAAISANPSASRAAMDVPATSALPTWSTLAGKPSTFPPIIGTGSGDAVAGNDPRLTNSRTPTAHKSSHATGGSDALTPADIGAAPAVVPLPAVDHILYAGDSFVACSDYYVPPAANFRGWAFSTWADVYLRQRLTRVRTAAGTYNFGTTGLLASNYWATWGTALTARIATLSDPSKCVVVLHIGTNDLNAGNSAATVLASVQTLCGQIEALGVKVLPCMVAPRQYATSGPDERVVLPKRVDYNKLLFADRPCIDIGNAGDLNLDGYQDTDYGGDPESSGSPRPGHPFEALASIIGDAVASKIESLYSLPADLDFASMTPLNDNNSFVGSAGTVWSPAVGIGATNWSFYATGTGTTLATMNGASGQKMMQTVTGVGSLNTQAAITTAYGGFGIAGDILEAFLVVDTQAEGWNMFSLNCGVSANSGGYSNTMVLRSSGTLAMPIVRRDRMVFRTPAVALPSSPVNLTASLKFYGSGTLTLQNCIIRKVP